MKEHNIPAEFQPLPPEHSIPDEFPKQKAEHPGKKKSSARRMMAMIAGSFMVLQLMFTYFVPPTTPPTSNPPIYTEPEWVDPGGDPSVKPPQNIVDFPLHAAPNGMDDQNLRQGLLKAFEKFDAEDYVRASTLLYKALTDYAIDGGNLYELPEICYGYGPHGVVDLGAKDIYSYVYFENKEVQYEEKDGSLYTEIHLGMNMVSFQDNGEETYYRTLSFSAPFDRLYGIYGAWVSYSAYYTDGGFKDGASTQCQQVRFEVYDGSSYSNLDDTYSVIGRNRIVGEVKNGAFMNDSILYTSLVLDAAQGRFETDPTEPDSFILFSELTPEGRLDFSNYAVLNNRDWTNDTAWEDFEADASIKYLAYEYSLMIKRFDYEQTHKTFELYDLDYSKPLLPVDMGLAFKLHTYSQNAPGIDPDNGNENQNNDPLAGINTMFYQDVAGGILEASNYFMSDDYIRTGAYFAECLYEYGVNMLNEFSDSQDAFEGFYDLSLYCDGKTISSVTQNGLPGCYFHFEKGSNWWIGNSGTKTHFTVMQVTVTRVEETAEGTRYRVVQFAVGAGANNPTYVPGALVLDHGDGLRYIEGVFDANGNCADCEITVFRNKSIREPANLDGKFSISGVRRLHGSVQNDAFMNGTVLYDNIVYDPAAHRLDAVSENGERKMLINFLNSDGKVDPSNPAVFDTRNSNVTNSYEIYRNDDTIRCMMSESTLTVKFDVQNQDYYNLQFADVDYSKPLFPLDMKVPFIFG